MKTLLRTFILFLTIFFARISFAKLFQVGPSRTYNVPSAVMNLVADGDTVEIDAGLYSGDVGFWAKNNLVIRGIGGYAHLDAAGKNAGGKAIWVIDGKNTYIENIEFSGCTVPDHNGAGIRQEADNLELRHCYFHDNEDGILTFASPTCDILFEACEFARNGYGDGYSHNMYIGNIRNFTMRFCYSHHAKVGHCVKSRARNNFIEYNRIMDEDTGSASYLINLPNGGFSIVLGNSMMKGPNAQNRTLVDYGSEGLSNPSKQLYVVNNTMVSIRPGGATFVSIASGTDTAKIINNIFAGVGNIVNGQADTIANAYSSTIDRFDFFDTSKFDYIHMGDNIEFSPLYGSDPGFAGSFSLTPTFEYLHPTDSIVRNDQFDGAFHMIVSPGLVQHTSEIPIVNFPNPFSEKTTIYLGSVENGLPITLNIHNALGEKILGKNFIPENSQILFERGNLPAGMYNYEIVNSKGERIALGKFIII
jgi:hypothetical protein